MRRALTCSGLLVLIALASFGQPNEWKRYKNEPGNFNVLFPADPQDSVNKSDSEVQSHTLLAAEKPAVYTVIYSAPSSEQKVDDATYQVFKNAVFKELPKCEVGSEQPASPALSGYIGRWYRLNCEMPNTKVTIVGNLYWGKHFAYAVMVMFPSNVAEPQMTDTFLKSFSVIDYAR